MAKALKKAKRKLKRRQDSFDSMKKSEKGFRRPGSMNRKKT